MNSLTIQAEVDPGISIAKASKDAIEQASKLNTTIEFTFNGIPCMAYPNTEFQNLQRVTFRQV
jgi:hypothetical protein